MHGLIVALIKSQKYEAILLKIVKHTIPTLIILW